MAFFMMGAKNFWFDNDTNTLRWQIANSSIKSVSVCYDTSIDLYDVSFLTETKTTISEIVIEQVEVSELHATIERMTGLRLSLARTYA
ncbi:hypothetical protein FAES_pFAES01033 (plasmid) [Fibrella aestuarina BUZ 2]|uniref:Uncharacterized protein n=2 Tax=Fibrella TaxID=861914 RepID=I0KHC4_9BACT|nr:hypothetical protein FAES_pFAES01033 [Fibrella aestuarina BUZ 2]